jgi:hypothetical protein
MRKTNYAEEKASASFKHARIERLLLKDDTQESIRFSWWKDGKFVHRPLDLLESDLLELMRAAIKEGVFAEEFLSALRATLTERASDAHRT